MISTPNVLRHLSQNSYLYTRIKISCPVLISTKIKMLHFLHLLIWNQNCKSDGIHKSLCVFSPLKGEALEISVIFKKIFVFLALLTVSTFCFAQETTGSLQGTVKDPSGAVVPNAKVSVSTANLVGGKSTVSDGKGFYHFSSLPPGAYVVRVEAKGFEALKQEGLIIEVGHAPSLDLTLTVGSAAETVDVTSESPQIDVTSVTTQTNVTQDVISYVPHGVSFQSVIQFAPAARQEPLQGSTALGNGTGGSSPGNASNGGSYGYSVAGGAD